MDSSATPAYTSRFETGARATQPSTIPVRRLTATNRWSARWASSNRSHGGATVSKLALSVSRPAWWMASTCSAWLSLMRAMAMPATSGAHRGCGAEGRTTTGDGGGQVCPVVRAHRPATTAATDGAAHGRGSSSTSPIAIDRTSIVRRAVAARLHQQGGPVTLNEASTSPPAGQSSWRRRSAASRSRWRWTITTAFSSAMPSSSSRFCRSGRGSAADASWPPVSAAGHISSPIRSLKPTPSRYRADPVRTLNGTVGGRAGASRCGSRVGGATARRPGGAPPRPGRVAAHSSQATLNGPSTTRRGQLSERHVEVEDVHVGLAEEAERTPLDVRLDEAAQAGRDQAASRGDHRHLHQRGGLRDVGVEAGEFRDDEVDWEG